ncbi:MAG: TetR/AcrR family transcriptional regulator, partial [Cyanobacteria bacterium J06559_3]
MESTHVTLSTQSKPVDPLNDKAKAILSGALQVFTTQGYAAASMDRIASAAGVSKPTLYRYFQDKETLFVTLIQQSMQKNRQLLFNLQTAPDLQHA